MLPCVCFCPIKGTKRENFFFFPRRGGGGGPDRVRKMEKIDPSQDIQSPISRNKILRNYMRIETDRRIFEIFEKLSREMSVCPCVYIYIFGGGRVNATLWSISSLRSCERNLERDGPTTIINHLFFASFRRRVSGIGKFGSPPRTGLHPVHQSIIPRFRFVRKKIN